MSAESAYSIADDVGSSSGGDGMTAISLLPTVPSSSDVDDSRSTSYSAHFLAPRVTHRSPSSTHRTSTPQPPSLTDCSEDDEWREKQKAPLLARLRRWWLRCAAGLTTSDALLIALVTLLPCLLLHHILVHDRPDEQFSSGDATLAATTASQTAAWETTHDLSVHYHLVLLNLLPYTDSVADSSGTSVTIRGQYSDRTSFTYPLCTFTRVCLTSSHVLLSFSNLTVHTFYSLTLPYCRDRLYRKFAVCGCFHGGYRPVVMPYALEASEDEWQSARRVAAHMIERRFGAGEVWMRDSQSADQRVVPAAREIPNMDELATTSHSSPRLYVDPFLSPSSPSTPASASASFNFRYFPSHFYTIHKCQHNRTHYCPCAAAVSLPATYIAVDMLCVLRVRHMDRTRPHTHVQVNSLSLFCATVRCAACARQGEPAPHRPLGTEAACHAGHTRSLPPRMQTHVQSTGAQ